MKRLNLSTLFDPVVENIAGFSKVQRILICVGVFVVLIGAFGYFSFYPKFNKIKELKASFEQLETKLSTSRIQAGQLSKYREKKKNAENQFKMVLKKLPEKKDIPSLLSAISRSGKDAGLDFVLFQPEAERVRDFYAEIPVAIQVAGSFHQVAQFFDKVLQKVKSGFTGFDGKVLLHFLALFSAKRRIG